MNLLPSTSPLIQNTYYIYYYFLLHLWLWEITISYNAVVSHGGPEGKQSDEIHVAMSQHKLCLLHFYVWGDIVITWQIFHHFNVLYICCGCRWLANVSNATCFSSRDSDMYKQLQFYNFYYLIPELKNTHVDIHVQLPNSMSLVRSYFSSRRIKIAWQHTTLILKTTIDTIFLIFSKARSLINPWPAPPWHICHNSWNFSPECLWLIQFTWEPTFVSSLSISYLNFSYAEVFLREHFCLFNLYWEGVMHAIFQICPFIQTNCLMLCIPLCHDIF